MNNKAPAMLGSPSQRKPTFLWQGVLILLPLGLLSSMALLAIQRDKASVEQEARQRAGELAGQLAASLGKRVPGALAAYDLFSLTWLKHELDIAKTSRPPRDDFERRLNEWQAANPGLRPEQALPNQLSFTEAGIMVWPVDYAQPPQAPRWFLSLTPEQRQAWEALQDAERNAATADSVARLRQFLDRTADSEGRANADFIWLRTRLAHEAGLNAALALQRAAQNYHGVRSEAGLPLLSLAAAEAIRLVRESGEAQNILLIDASDKGNVLSWVIDEPSVLSPMLIAQLQSMVDSKLLDASRFESPIQSAAVLYSCQQRLHDLAETIRGCGLLRNSVTNFWINSPAGRWFCRMTPEVRKSSSKNSSPPGPRLTNEVLNVHVYPKSVIEHTFAMECPEPGLSFPDYFEPRIRLENEPLSLGKTPSPVTDPAPRQSALLAETRTHFAPVPVSIASALPLNEGLGTAAGRGGAESGPQMTVQIYLINPGLLFARQRQRTWIFAGLLLASALAALVGFIAAHRSFRRQLRLSELKSNFVSSVSHELRAPIASVRLMAESLERGKINDPQKQHQYFAFIVQECRRLSSLIENVLDFSRIEQGRKQFEFEPIDVLGLAEQTVRLMEAYATERQVTLVLATAASEASVAAAQLLADGKAIQQALINLIDNAVKHSPRGQTVTVGLEMRNAECGMRNDKTPGAQISAETKSYVALWVEDNGEGIPAEEHEKIFERFYRLGSELRRETQGVGIGLSIVKHAVEAHGGRVLVRSEPGKGSRFTIELPATQK